VPGAELRGPAGHLAGHVDQGQVGKVDQKRLVVRCDFDGGPILWYNSCREYILYTL
jgi:hypothetical protein